MSSSEVWPYRSPISKLLAFFRRSRDNWKTKCQEAKRENKSLKYGLAKMTEKRDRWKTEARSLAKRVAEDSAPPKEETHKKSAGRSRRQAVVAARAG
jgi:hypothetical protein